MYAYKCANLLNTYYFVIIYCVKTVYSISYNIFRPLPNELIAYAREDTHYLLYIYDMMKNALLDAANGKTNLLMSVIQRSTELCKKV